MRGIDPHKWDGYTDHVKKPHEKRCMGTSKVTGRRCGSMRTPGFEVCRKHGGVLNTGRPIKHGGFSKYLGPMFEKYRESLKDKASLTDMLKPLALMEAIVSRVAERMTDRDTPEFRTRAFDLFEQSRKLAATDPAKAAEAMNDLGKLLRVGASESACLRQLSETASRLHRGQESLWKIRLMKSQAITGQELHLLLARFMDIISQETSPDDALRIGQRWDLETSSGRAFGKDGAAHNVRPIGRG